MVKRKAEKDYRRLAARRGFVWVEGVVPKNTKVKTLWRCNKCGYFWKTAYSKIQQGIRCPKCMGIAKKVEKDYHDLASQCGSIWVGTALPKNVITKTLWQCDKCSYQWEAKYNDVQQGTGCPKCAGNFKKAEQDYYDLADFYGFTWVDTELPKNTIIGTLWKCKKCGHRWKACYSEIRKGHRCLRCSGKLKKVEKDYHNLVVGRNITWVGKILPKNIKTKTVWKCKKCCFCWKVPYNSIYNGSGCPRCARNFKKVEKDYYNLVAGRDILWIGKVLPKNVDTKTLWECIKCGYTWKAMYSNIQRGTGCPHCQDIVNGSSVSKPQRKLNDLLCGSLNYPEGKYRIDVAIMRNNQKIAVEYDCQYWHQGNEEHDKKRDKYLISRGWKMLHIKSGKLLPTRKQLKCAIKELLNTKKSIINVYLDDWK